MKLLKITLRRNKNMSSLIATTTVIYAILLGLCTEEVSSMSMLAGHYHHNKRQQSALSPTLTLDVEPHPGLVHSYANHTPITEYYFPVDSGVLNFTCTIKHPSFKYKLTMVREQLFNSEFLDDFFCSGCCYSLSYQNMFRKRKFSSQGKAQNYLPLRLFM